MAGLALGVAFAGSLLLAPPAAQADTTLQATSHGETAVLEIRRAAGPIRIDGELDDEGWAGAARVTGFTEFRPREGARPPVETEVWITYDDAHLYVAFIAYDEPRRIRAGHRERDRIFGDDFVGVLLDTYGDASRGVLLLANPYGIQADLLLTGDGGEDPSYAVIYESAGRITERGYQVEMAIPFTSLRFPDREAQVWRVNFIRDLPRASRHQIAWVPFRLDDVCFLCRTAQLRGLEGVRPGGGLELLPSIVASQAGLLADFGDPTAGLDNESVSGQASLGARYAFSNGWTVEGTYNPDFSQVESDAAQVDVNTTFAILYPERRPFFQEGADLFDTWVDVVHTRSINAPRFAGKVTGRAGKTSIAYLAARDDRTPFVVPFDEWTGLVEAGRSTSNLLRVRRDLGSGTWAGLLLTDRRLEGGGSGTTLSADVRLRFGQHYYLQSQIAGSYTVEPDDPSLGGGLRDHTFGRGEREYTAAFDGERFAGHAGYLWFGRRARVWNFDLQYWEFTPTYRADLGFQTRNDFRRYTAGTGVSFYFDDGWIERVSPWLSATSRTRYDGGWTEQALRPSLNVSLIGQTHVNLSGSIGRERFRGVEFDGIRRASLYVNSQFSDPVRLGLSVAHGRTIARRLETPVLGEGTDVSLWSELRPSARLRIGPSVSYSRLIHPETDEAIHDGYIVRSRFDYQFTRELSLRFVAQYNDFSGGLSLEPLLTYRINPFSIFYIGSTHDYADFGDPHGFAPTRRQFFAKFQYLFRV